MRTRPDTLSTAEWDFRSLRFKHPSPQQQTELTAATYYEYARESDSLRELAQEYAALPKALRHDIEERTCLLNHFLGLPAGARPFSERLAHMDHVPYQRCILWPEHFPQKPWLEIPPARRAERIQLDLKANPPGFLLTVNEYEHPKPGMFSAENEFGEIPDHDPNLPNRGARVSFSRGIENLIVSINWTGGNDSDIVSAFADWVRKSRPKDYPEPRNDAARENVDGAFLNRLAVMRLLHSYGHAEAWNLAMDRGLPFPKQQSNALRMRRQVTADLRRLFFSEAFDSQRREPLLSAGELPRSYATWAGKRPRLG